MFIYLANKTVPTMKLPITRGVYYYRAKLCTIDPLLAKYPHVMSANRHADVFAWLMCTRSAGYTHRDLCMLRFTTANRATIKAYRITVALDGEAAEVIMVVGRRGDLRKYLHGTSTGYHSSTHTRYINYLNKAHRTKDSLAVVSSTFALDITAEGEPRYIHQWAAFFSKDSGDIRAHLACSKCIYPTVMIEC